MKKCCPGAISVLLHHLYTMNVLGPPYTRKSAQPSVMSLIATPARTSNSINRFPPRKELLRLSGGRREKAIVVTTGLQMAPASSGPPGVGYFTYPNALTSIWFSGFQKYPPTIRFERLIPPASQSDLTSIFFPVPGMFRETWWKSITAQRFVH